MRWILAVLLGMLVSACGSGSDVTVRVNGSPAQVIAPLSLASVGEFDALVPGLKVIKSRPSDRELLYTFPGDGSHDPATMLFTLTPTGNGEATDVHAEVDVPLIKANVGGKMRFLSADKIGNAIREVLEKMNGKGRDSATAEMSGILFAMAISTDQAKLEKVLAGDASSLLRFEDRGEGERDYAANDPTEYDKPYEANDPTRIDTPYEGNDPTEYDTPESDE